MKNKMLLSIGLLLSFAGIHAMSDQEFLQFAVHHPKASIIKQYLIQQHMFPQEVLENLNNYYLDLDFHVPNKTFKFRVMNKTTQAVQYIDITALIPQIQNLSNNQE